MGQCLKIIHDFLINNNINVLQIITISKMLADGNVHDIDLRLKNESRSNAIGNVCHLSPLPRDVLWKYV